MISQCKSGRNELKFGLSSVAGEHIVAHCGLVSEVRGKEFCY
jgi:hypothetical protein